MCRKLLFITLLILSFYSANAQTIVRTSEELQNVLAQDKEVGDIRLDGDWFHIEGVKVNMGGRIKLYGKRKPVLVGSHSADCYQKK